MRSQPGIDRTAVHHANRSVAAWRLEVAACHAVGGRQEDTEVEAGGHRGGGRRSPGSRWTGRAGQEESSIKVANQCS